MKIYREVTIDMNPESSSYEKHLSEDSYNYNGPLDLAGKDRKWITAMVWEDAEGNEYSLELKRKGYQSDPGNIGGVSGGEGGTSLPTVKHATIHKKAKGSDSWTVVQSVGSQNIQESRGTESRHIETIEAYIRDVATPKIIGHISDYYLPANLFGATSRTTAGKSLKEFAMDLGAEEWAFDSAKADNPGKHIGMEELAEYNTQLRVYMGKVGELTALENIEGIPDFKFDEDRNWVEQLGGTKETPTDYSEVDLDNILDTIGDAVDDEGDFDSASFSVEQKNIIGLAQYLQDQNPSSTIEQALTYIDNLGADEVVKQFLETVTAYEKDVLDLQTELDEDKLDVEDRIDIKKELIYGEGAGFNDDGTVMMDEAGNIVDSYGNLIVGGQYQGTQDSIIAANDAITAADANITTAEGVLDTAIGNIADIPDQVKNQLEAVYDARNVKVGGLTEGYATLKEDLLNKIYSAPGDTVQGAAIRDAQKQRESYLRQLGLESRGLITNIEGIKEWEAGEIGEEGIQYDADGNIVGAGGSLGDAYNTSVGNLATAQGNKSTAQAQYKAFVDTLSDYDVKLDLFESKEWSSYGTLEDAFERDKENLYTSFENELGVFSNEFGSLLGLSESYLWDLD